MKHWWPFTGAVALTVVVLVAVMSSHTRISKTAEGGFVTLGVILTTSFVRALNRSANEAMTDATPGFNGPDPEVIAQFHFGKPPHAPEVDRSERAAGAAVLFALYAVGSARERSSRRSAGAKDRSTTEALVTRPSRSWRVCKVTTNVAASSLAKALSG